MRDKDFVLSGQVAVEVDSPRFLSVPAPRPASPLPGFTVSIVNAVAPRLLGILTKAAV